MNRIACLSVRSLILAVAATGTLLSVGQVSATVIAFDGLAHYSGYPLYSYQESGFTVTGSGSFVEWFGSGNPLPSIETAWPGGFGGPRTVQVTSGDLFTFDAVDIRTTVGVVDYTIRGLLGGSDEFVMLMGSADDGTNWAHVLGDSITLIDTLIITLTRVSAVSAQIDNIGVTAVFEPTTLSLLALGFAGLGFSRRRKLN